MFIGSSDSTVTISLALYVQNGKCVSIHMYPDDADIYIGIYRLSEYLSVFAF
jgi:hypothetical protein